MGLTGLATVCLALVPDNFLVIPLFLQPMAAVCFFPPAFAALARMGPPETRNVSVSFTVPAAFVLGAGIAPITIGAMGDAWSFSIGIGIFGSLILLSMIPAASLKLSS
jgi:MFS transporter, NNP family, nitrate/nitrite transporter